jgi:hypothetical protein
MEQLYPSQFRLYCPMTTRAFERYESQNEANFVYCPSLGERSPRLPMRPTVKCHDSLERMKPYAGAQSQDEP